MALGRWALGTGYMGAAASSQIRTLIAIGGSQVAGPRDALAELEHLDADPARVGLVDVHELWRPLLAEGLIGSGQADRAAVVLERMRAEDSQVS